MLLPLICLGFDLYIVIVYLLDPAAYGDNLHGSIFNLLDIDDSIFLLIILSFARIIFIIPYIWQWYLGHKLTFASIKITWEWINIIIVSIKAILLILHGHGFDKQWILIFFSFGSITAQFYFLLNLKSSASDVPYRLIFLRSTFNPEISQHLLSSQNNNNEFNNNNNNNNNTENEDLLNKWVKKMEIAKQTWDKKLKLFQNRIRDISLSRHELLSPFHLLIRLYAHEDNVIIDLKESFRYNSDNVCFYLPQFINFLLWGSGYNKQSHELETFLLETCCQKDIFIAHTLFWYLRSFSLQGIGLNDEGINAIQDMMNKSITLGNKSAILLSVGRGPHEKQYKLSLNDNNNNQKILPLFHENNNSLKYGAINSDNNNNNNNNNSNNNNKTNFYSIYFFKKQRDINKINYDNRKDNNKLESYLKFDKILQNNLFCETIKFIDILDKISEALISIPLNDRNNYLKSLLNELNNYILPSTCIYIPIGKKNHRVWSIIIDECFAFSTKERAPCFICLEILEYDQIDKKKKNHWWTQFTKSNRKKKKRKKKKKKNYWKINNKKNINNQEVAYSAPGYEYKYFPQYDIEQGKNDDNDDDYNDNDDDYNDNYNDNIYNSSSESDDDDDNDDDFYNNNINEEDKFSLSKWFNKIKKLKEKKKHINYKKNNSDDLYTPDRYSMNLKKINNNNDNNYYFQKNMGQWDSPAPNSYRFQSHTVKKNRNASFDQELLTPIKLQRTFSDPNQENNNNSPLNLFPSMTENNNNNFNNEFKNDDEINNNDEFNNDNNISNINDDDVDNNLPTVIFREKWKQKEERIKITSPIGHLPGWHLLPIIIKSNDDLRQEQFASQLVKQMGKILKDADLPVYLRSYQVIATSISSGIVEAVPDTVSLDALKRNDPYFTTLKDFFERHFGEPDTKSYRLAKNNFIESLAPSCIMCYLLQLKDRHNGNILLDSDGHIVHIDFGFILAKRPGNVDFEKAPFKLTEDFVELMDGPRSIAFRRFRELCVRIFMEIRKQRHKLLLLLEMMINGNEHLSCFGGNPELVVEEFENRLKPQLNDMSCMEHVHDLIDQSIDNWRTKWYDRYQRCWVGIF